MPQSNNQISIEQAASAPFVSQEHIDDLMARVEYRCDHTVGTTSTFCHAFLDGEFHLATGHSACVSPENFKVEIGLRIAQEDAMQKAEQQLWVLEGYLLRHQLKSE